MHVFCNYLTRVVVATSDNTLLDPVTPCCAWEATVTAKAASVTARNEVLG